MENTLFDKFMIRFVIPCFVLVVVFIIAMAGYFITVSATDSWILEDEVYQTVEGGRRLRHFRRVDPWFRMPYARCETEIVPEKS